MEIMLLVMLMIRPLGGSRVQGVNKALKAASERVAKLLKDTVSKGSGIQVKDVSSNTIVGGLSGVVARLIDLNHHGEATPALRAAVSQQDLSTKIQLADRTIENWTVKKLVRTQLNESLQSGVLKKVGESYVLDWKMHSKQEERATALQEQEQLRFDGGSITITGRGAESWLSATSAKRVLHFLRFQDDQLLKLLMDCAMETILAMASNA